MTINQILDKIILSNIINDDIVEAKEKLVNLKKEFGGNMKVENYKEILNKLIPPPLDDSISKTT